jgi:carboxyl-terminal processing protease
MKESKPGTMTDREETNREESIEKKFVLKLREPFRIRFVTIVLFIVFIIVASARISRSSVSIRETTKEHGYFSLFSEVVSLVKDDYVENVNPEEKFPGAFSGMLDSLDHFSTYLDKSKTGIYNLYRQDKACSCGIYGVKHSGYFLITGVAKDSPADSAGIKPGYLIRAVDGKSIFGWSFWQMYLSLFSDKPVSIDVVLFKKDSGNPIGFKLQTRFPGDEPIIKKLENNILLIELTRIDNAHVTALRNHLAQGMQTGRAQKLIIDLRRYEIGELQPFIELTKIFFKRSISLTLKSKKESKLLTLGSDKAINYRAVVIIDKSTMMYGELLANLFKIPGAENRIILLGNKTRGFTSKLSQIPLKDGASILLADGFFLINEIYPLKTGVTPDTELKPDDFPSVIDRCVSILNNTHG